MSVLAPADDETPLPPYVVSAGRAVPVPYNGSVARLNFGFLSAARVRRWLHDGTFDVIHIHEPTSPSLGLLACWAAQGPIVATFHTSNPRSRAMIAAYPILQPALEKISARIAVSEYARRTLVEHLGGDAVVIPNGVDVDFFAKAEPKPEWQGGTIGFIGRIDEPRKGLPVLMRALPKILAARPETRLLVAGRGDEEEAVAAPAARSCATGSSSSAWSATRTRRGCCAASTCTWRPTPAARASASSWSRRMSAGAPVLASDLDAFAQVLDQGAAGELFANEDADALAGRGGAAAGRPGAPGRAARRGAARTCGASTGRRSGRTSSSVYETVTDGAAVGGGRRADRAAGPVRPGPGLTGRGGVAAEPGRPATTGRSPRPRRSALGRQRGSLAPVTTTSSGSPSRSSRSALYLSWTAGRLDRLHARIDAARAALDAQLLRRASVAQELATSGVLDPAASIVLYEAAHAARQAEEEQREVAESELSQALRAVFGEPPQVEAVREAPGGEDGGRANWPRPYAGCRWPGASTTTPCARPGRCAGTARSAGSGWPATRRSRWPSRWTTSRRRPWRTAPGPERARATGRRVAAGPEPSHRLAHWPLLWTGPLSGFLGAADASPRLSTE